MKKTLLALAVLAGTVSTAQAAVNAYDQNGITVDVTGAAEVQMVNLYDNDDSFRIDDGDLGIYVEAPINGEWSTLAGLGFAFEDTGVETDETFVGFKSKTYGTLTLGRQYLLTDDAGIGKDYELGAAGVDFVQTQATKAYKYVWDNGNFYFGTSGFFHETGKVLLPNSVGSTDVDNAEGYDLRVGYRTGNLDARIYAYTGDRIASSLFDPAGGVDADAVNLEIEYQMTEKLGLAFSYGFFDYDIAGTSTGKDANVFQLAADYAFTNSLTFAAGANWWSDTDVDAGIADEDVQVYYMNLTKQLNNYASVYGEIGYNHTEVDNHKDDDFGYVLGMEVTF